MKVKIDPRRADPKTCNSDCNYNRTGKLRGAVLKHIGFLRKVKYVWEEKACSELIFIFALIRMVFYTGIHAETRE